MDFTLQFVLIFAHGLFLAMPIVACLTALIAVAGLAIGRGEGWSRLDALYYAFITATTVGYGDYRPTRTFGKLAAIGVALLGLLLTGIVVAIGVQAAKLAFLTIPTIAATG